jgi:hypothetical protein
MINVNSKRNGMERFIRLIQAEVVDDIKEHVFNGDASYEDSKMAYNHLSTPVVNYIVAMVLDNLLRKDLLLMKDIHS